MSSKNLCIICHQTNISLLALNYNEIQEQNTDETSLSITDLQQAQCSLKRSKRVKPKPCSSNYLQNHTANQLNDTNNNDSIFGHKREEKMLNYCTSHNLESNDPFTAWECELNKVKDIDDSAFSNTISGLCNDLKTVKYKVKKRKPCKKDVGIVKKDEKKFSNIVKTEVKTEFEECTHLGSQPSLASASCQDNKEITTDLVSSFNSKESDFQIKKEINSERISQNSSFPQIRIPIEISSEPSSQSSAVISSSYEQNLTPSIINNEGNSDDIDKQGVSMIGINLNKNILIYDSVGGYFVWSQFNMDCELEEEDSNNMEEVVLESQFDMQNDENH